jgi:hypothetical protein
MTSCSARDCAPTPPWARPDGQPGRDHQVRDRARVGGRARLRVPPGAGHLRRSRSGGAVAFARGGCRRSTASSHCSQLGLSGHENPRCLPIRGPPAAARLLRRRMPGRETTAAASTTTTSRPTTRARALLDPDSQHGRGPHVDRTEFELGRAETRLRHYRADDHLEVRNAARNLAASQEGIVAAQDARRAAAGCARAHPPRVRRVDALRRAPARAARRPRERADPRLSGLPPVGHGARSRAGTILRNRNISIAESPH